MKTTRSLLPWALLLSLAAAPVAPALAGDQAVSKNPLLIPEERPLPFGVGVTYVHQKQDYLVTDLQAVVPVFLPPQIPFETQQMQVPPLDSGAIQKVINELDLVTGKIDWWALPMLNVHLLYGQFEGTAEAVLAPAIASLIGPLAIPYDGQTYGGGLTLAAGWKRLFASVTVDYTWTDVDMHDLSAVALDDPDGVETLVVLPKIGCRVGDAMVWVGAGYQRTRHVQTGAFELPPLGSIPFEATAEDEHHWNAVTGFEWMLIRHWSVMAEAGLGDRRQAVAGVTYRF